MEIEERELKRAMRSAVGEAEWAQHVYGDKPYALSERRHQIVDEHVEKLKNGYFSSLK